MTAEKLQDALVADLQELFKHHRLTSSTGMERAIQVFARDLPVREGDDEDTDAEAPPEPYIVVRTRGGKIADDTAPHVVDVVIVICVCDEATDRQGYRDAMHILQTIQQKYATCNVIGKRWMMLYPIDWSEQEEDTHPYYFTAMSFQAEGPVVRKEIPDT